MTGSRSTSSARRSAPRAPSTPAQDALEIVHETVNEVVDLEAVYDTLVSLLLRYHRRQHSPSEARTR